MTVDGGWRMEATLHDETELDLVYFKNIYIYNVTGGSRGIFIYNRHGPFLPIGFVPQSIELVTRR